MWTNLEDVPLCGRAQSQKTAGGFVSDYIRFCSDIGSDHQLGLAIGAALKNVMFAPHHHKTGVLIVAERDTLLKTVMPLDRAVLDAQGYA